MPIWLAFKGLSAGRKALVIIGVLVALIGSVTLLVRTVSARDERLKQAGRDEVQASWNAEKAGRQEAKADFAVSIGASLTPQFDRLASTISGIDTKGADINVRMPQAVAADPRYRDPSCSLTEPALNLANTARAMSDQGGKP